MLGGPAFEVRGHVSRNRRETMLGKDVVDQNLKRDLGLSLKELEPLLGAGGDAAEIKFMECCRLVEG
jgi:hypothetical protein